MNRNPPLCVKADFCQGIRQDGLKFLFLRGVCRAKQHRFSVVFVPIATLCLPSPGLFYRPVTDPCNQPAGLVIQYQARAYNTAKLAQSNRPR